MARFRELLDSSAAEGVPAHITVLYPFLPADAIDSQVLSDLERLFGVVSRFNALIRTTCAAYPSLKPYGGQHDEVIPHLTVGDRAALDDLRAAEESIRPWLPIAAHADAVTLMAEQSNGRWATVARFTLA